MLAYGCSLRSLLKRVVPSSAFASGMVLLATGVNAEPGERAQAFLPLPLVTSPRDDFDALNFQRLSDASAHKSLLDGEALHAKGEYAGALAKYQEALELAPENLLLHRRQCEAMVASGRRTEGLDACRKAVRTELTAPNMRALTGALMTGSGVPSMADVSEAQYWADHAVEQKGQRHWGYAAACDIAFRLRDASLQRKCLQKLEEFAANHQETKRAKSMTIHLAYPAHLGYWLGLGLACLLTLAHAVAGRARLLTRAKPLNPVAGTAALLVLLWGAPVNGQVASELGAGSEFPVNDADPESSIPKAEERNANPLQFGYWLMEVADRGEEALRTQDYDRAARFYRALAKAVPDRATAFSKLCQIYEESNHIDQAIEACSQSLGLDGTSPVDAHRYLHLMLKKPELTALEKKDVADVFAHLESQGEGSASSFRTADLLCQASARNADVKGLKQCLPQLEKHAPGTARTLSFQFALAVAEGNFEQAGVFIEKAKAAGMAAPGLEAMHKALSVAKSRAHNLWGIVAAGALGLSLGLVFLLRARAKKKPSGPTPGAVASPEPELQGS